jgi:hypothetical protein
MGLLKKLRHYFIQNSVVHLHQDVAANPGALVGLMDRFLDGTSNYPLEWDDFISWEQENLTVEAIRDRIGELEPHLFSKKPEKMRLYYGRVLEERNRLAATRGVPCRQPDTFKRLGP